MITRIDIRDFQSLRKTGLELGTVTVIVGQNDTGKSALIRAIRAASEATSGTDFITYGAQKSVVALTIDGKTLVWEKGAQVNRYSLIENHGLPDQKIQKFEKVGRQVPEEVAALLGTGKVEFDKDLSLNLNFADQDDPPFLIPAPGGTTPAQVAKVLGDLTNLNLLYRAVADADTRRKRADSLLKVRVTDLDARKAALTQYSDLDAQEARVTKLRTLRDEAKSLTSKHESLLALRNRKTILETNYSQLTAKLAKSPPDLTTQLAELQTLLTRHAALRHNATKLAQLRTSLDNATDLANRLKQLEQTAQNELNELLSQTATCPLCDQPLAHEHSLA